MIVNKITTGFVIQQFDTEKQKFVGQHFVAGDQCEYETADGQVVESDLLENELGEEQYLPFDMCQPNEIQMTAHWNPFSDPQNN